jgi:hypothetical protein
MSQISLVKVPSWQSPIIVTFIFDLFLFFLLLILIFEAQKFYKFYYKKSDFIFLSNEQRKSISDKNVVIVQLN